MEAAAYRCWMCRCCREDVRDPDEPLAYLRLKNVGAFRLSYFREAISNVFARGYTAILGGVSGIS